MSMERPSSPEKQPDLVGQLLINSIDQDIAQLEESMKRLKTLKEKGAVYDPLDEDVEIYDEEKDITEKTRETVAATLERKSNLLEQLSDLKDFWHYYMGEIIKWNPEKEELPDFKARLKQFLEENLERSIWILQEIRGVAAEASLGALNKKNAYKALVILRKALNVLKDPELLAYDDFEQELEITEATLVESHKQLEESMV